MAREFGIDPVLLARMVRLANLAPEIQEHIRALPPVAGQCHFTERRLRPLVRLTDWAAQMRAFRELLLKPLRRRKANLRSRTTAKNGNKSPP
ncbi:MAG: hypothetical protein HZB91_10200 [Elusimicrobia bacterium]|nr:hypothetical protein [Elusimicrobiota bacterium]